LQAAEGLPVTRRVADGRIHKGEAGPAIMYGVSAIVGAFITAIMLWNDGITLLLIGIPIGAGFAALAVDLIIYCLKGEK
jgi:hypothetical protein